MERKKLPITHIRMPTWPISKTHPFSKTSHKKKSRQKLDVKGNGDPERQRYFLSVISALHQDFGKWVPFHFATPDDETYKVRSMDLGCLKYAITDGDLLYDPTGAEPIERVQLTEAGRRKVNPSIVAQAVSSGDTIETSAQAITKLREDEPIDAEKNALGTDHLGSGSALLVAPDNLRILAQEADVATLMDPIRAAEIAGLEIDERAKVIAEHVLREQQAQFKGRLISAYGGKCALLNTKVVAALDAAHIRPYRGEKSNQVWNGILLRADLHRLFDAGLLCFEYRQDSLVTLVAAGLQGSTYMKNLAGRPINLPQSRVDWPAKAVIDTDRAEKQVKNAFHDTPPL